ncbi:MAG TPA: carboxypeptidase-like regulatory domain-containing protein [Candidatus Limnocylindria bacterium]|nr:carboxypeptidase-like regulatory domain-containing protein [Candidatus Limnocylindria bacterium]
MRRALAGLMIALAAAACDSPPAITLPELFRPPAESTLSVRALGPQGPVARARVCASAPSGAGERCATTDAKGEAAFRLRHGTYLVRGEPPEGARMRQVAAIHLEVAGASDAVVLFETLARISGRIASVEGRPAVNAQVCAHPTTHDAPVCERTKADGVFVIEAVPGTYKVHADGPPDGSRLIPQWARGRVASYEADIIDTRGGEAVGVDLVLLRGHVVSGAVTAARDGTPVKEAQVCTQTLAAPLPWDCERTDKDGRYAALREPGSYWVWVIPPDDGGRLLPQRYDRADIGINATPLRIDRDVALDVGLRDGPLLSGRVVMPDGAPVAFAHVCVDTPFPTGRICRPTDAEGRYSVATRPELYAVQVVPAGDSEAVSVYYDGKRDWSEADGVRVSGDVRLDIVVPRGVRLTGTVRTETGVPVESAPVNVNDARGFLLGTYTDISGHYALALPPGSYTIDVFAPRVSRLVSRTGLPLRIDAEMGLDVVLPFAAP